MWYYTVGQSRDGRTIMIGPEASKEKAYERGFHFFDGIFEVYELPTRDRARATQMLKAKLLEQTGDLTQALRPIRHTIENRGTRNTK